ncbi:MAG: hypothetical protein LH609_22520, partial [Rudanella sp.]|nr:hypothetical protein [Rudanella sp.]
MTPLPHPSMKNALRLLSLLFWLSLSLSSYSQDDLKFEHLTTEQGLSNNSMWSICQDREGFMWFGTLDGLNRYDGYTFKVFRADPRDPEHTLQHNIISAIHEDRAGRLWVATLGGGLHQVDKRTGNVTPYRIDPTRVNVWNVMSSIYEDRQGILWLGAGKGIARFDPRTKQFTLYPSPPERRIGDIVEDTTGQLWAGNGNQLLRFDRQTGQYTVFPTNYLGQSFVLRSLYITRDGLAWMGTDESGLFRMGPRQPGQFTPYIPKNGTINKVISYKCLYESGGYLWVGTSEGLQRIDQRTNQVVTYQANPELPNRLIENTVRAIYRDRSGTLWVGTASGLNKVIAHPKRFNAYQLIPTLPAIRRNENNISTVLEDHTGTLWIGNAGTYTTGDFESGLYRYDTKRKQAEHIPANLANPNGLLSEAVRFLYEDRTGQLWVGTPEGLHRFDRATGTFTRYPSMVSAQSITEDLSGNLWICGRSSTNNRSEGIASFNPTTGNNRSEGIASFNPTTGQYVNYLVDPTNPNGLKADISGLFASRTGLIYVATGADGVNRLDPKTGKITKYLPDYVSPKGHLNDKEVHNFYEDPDGIIWLGTRLGGLHRFDPKTERFTYFTTQDG